MAKLQEQSRVGWMVCAAVCSLASLSASARACDIPVFMYALEFWPADPYQVVVFHRGGLDEPAGRALERLREGTARANLDLHEVDLDGAPSPLAHLYRPEPADAAPWMVVRYPLVAGPRPVLWAGPLTEPAVESWLDSPARRRIVERLLERDSAVWVLLTSGDARKDQAAQQSLQTHLSRLERTLRPASPDHATEVAVRFGVIKVDGEDPAEAALVAMLRASEPDLAGRADEPMVFPLYGRGLVLYALVGEGINEWTLTEAAEFLVGPCSCQAKALNPGLDLLLSVDWNAHVEVTAWAAPAPLVGAGEFAARAQQAQEWLSDAPAQADRPAAASTTMSELASPPGADVGSPAAEASQPDRMLRNLLFMLTGGVVGLVGVTVVRFRRRARGTR